MEQYVAIFATAATFVAGFGATIFAFLKESARREDAFRAQLLKQNIAFSTEIGKLRARISELETTIKQRDSLVQQLQSELNRMRGVTVEVRRSHE